MNNGLENPMAKLFQCLSISILFLFVGYIFGLMYVPESFIYVANGIAALIVIMLLFMSFFSRKQIIPRRFSMNFVYLYSLLNGIMISPVIKYYVGYLGVGVVVNVLIATMIIFGFFSFIASKNNDGRFLKLGNILYAALIGLCLMSILNLLFFGKVINMAISFTGIVVFSAYILYDISLFKLEIQNGDIVDTKDLSIYVLNIYLDIVNIFLDLLRVISLLKD